MLLFCLLAPIFAFAQNGDSALIVIKDSPSTIELNLLDKLQDSIKEEYSSSPIEKKTISEVDGLNIETLTFVLYEKNMKIIITDKSPVGYAQVAASMQVEGVDSKVIWDFEVKSSDLQELFIPPKEEVCVDSDSGKNYYVKGQARIGDRKEYTPDECYGDRLSEAYCNDAGGTSIDYHFCEFGCKDGACLESSEEPRPHSMYLINEPIGEFSLSRFNTVEIEGKTQIEGHYSSKSIQVDVWILFPVDELDTSDLEKIKFGDEDLYYKEYNDMRGTEKVYKWVSEDKRISINTYGAGVNTDINPVIEEYLDKYPIEKEEPEIKKGFFQTIIDWFMGIINWFKNLFG